MVINMPLLWTSILLSFHNRFQLLTLQTPLLKKATTSHCCLFIPTIVLIENSVIIIRAIVLLTSIRRSVGRLPVEGLVVGHDRGEVGHIVLKLHVHTRLFVVAG